IIDRVLERGRLLRLDGPSVRTLHVNLDDAMKEDSDQQADLIRISGNTCPEFPEPTEVEDENCVVGFVRVLEGKAAFLANMAPELRPRPKRQKCACDSELLVLLRGALKNRRYGLDE